jgi:hypothetical protein
VRTAIIGIGAFVVGLLLGAIVGIVAGTLAAPEQASSPRTITETRYVTVVEPQEASASSSASASASASAGAPVPDKECKVGQECDLGPGSVTVTAVSRAKALNESFSGTTYNGNFVVVEFEYVYGGSGPATTGDNPWLVENNEGQTFTWASDETIGIGIDRDRDLVSVDVQPGIPNPGLVVFELAPDSEPSALYIGDLVNPQGGDVARLEL